MFTISSQNFQCVSLYSNKRAKCIYFLIKQKTNFVKHSESGIVYTSVHLLFVYFLSDPLSWQACMLPPPHAYVCAPFFCMQKTNETASSEHMQTNLCLTQKVNDCQ